MIVKALLSLLLMTQVAYGFESQTPLRKYINEYPQPSVEEMHEMFGSLYDVTTEQGSIYDFHFNGPEDDGTANSPKETWDLEQFEKAKEAAKLVKEILKLRPYDLNMFTNELMSVYLKEPQSRPAIKQVLGAMESLLFNEERLNELDRAISLKTTISRGGIWTGTIGLGALCLLKRSRCNEIIRNANIIKRLKEGKGSKPKKTKAQAQLEKSQKTLQEMIREVKVAHGTAGEARVETLGGAMMKDSYYKQYAMQNLMDQGGALAWFGGFFVAGATVDTLYTRIKSAIQEGDLNYELLDPIDLERMYYGSLAVTELTCQVREQLAKDITDADQSRRFVINAHSELQILGRITGDIKLLQKKDLNFVTALPESGQIKIELPHMTEPFYRPCPGIQETGEGVSASLDELGLLMSQLIEKVANAE